MNQALKIGIWTLYVAALFVGLSLGYRELTAPKSPVVTPVTAWTMKNAFTHYDVSNFLAGLDADQALTAKVVRAEWVIGTSKEAPFTIWYQEKR